MKTVKMYTAIILLVALVFSLAACAGVSTDQSDPTSVPQSASATSEAGNPDDELEVDQNTIEPNSTEELSVQVQKINDAYAKLGNTPFESCAEKVFSGVPGSADCPYYCYTDAEDSKETVMNVPLTFSVDGSRIYINDRQSNPEDRNSVFVFDMDTGTSSRVACSSDVLGVEPFVVADGKLYTTHSAEDLTTGELKEFTPCISDQQEGLGCCFMTASQGNVLLFVGEDMTETPWSRDSYIFTLDTASNIWSEREPIERLASPFSYYQPRIAGFAPDGTLCSLLWLGKDGVSYPVIAHMGADGSPISYTKLPYTADQMHYADGTPSLVYAADGYMYFMICSAEEVAIWRVDLP